VFLTFLIHICCVDGVCTIHCLTLSPAKCQARAESMQARKSYHKLINEYGELID
jgi:hypothetical protein